MTVVIVGSLKGAPGATTVAMLLAGAWSDGAVVVEADPDGGAIAARAGVTTAPGLATLAAACRHGRDVDIGEHFQRLGTIDVAPAPGSADGVRAALASGVHLGPALVDAPTNVVVDCGRLTPGTPAAPLLAVADVTLVVCRPRLDELQHVATRAAALREAGSEVRLVLVGESPYTRSEVERALGVPVAGVLPHEPRTAAAIATGRFDDPRLKRSRLVRASAGLVGWLRPELHPDHEAGE